ncbi:MAG: hypothetical protein KQJ78_03510 [Deltaproteobacteria bacterium]|nr:hypothetical protein [Deltaproteobacteria bacterium]
MSRASKIVVLCEDKAHKNFIYRFLKRGWNIRPPYITFPRFPSGSGSGRRFVEERFPNEYVACLSRSATTILIVVRDADEQPVSEVKSTLLGKLQKAKRKNISAENVVFIIPKWHIETWIAYLDNKTVDESDKETYKSEYGKIAGTNKVHWLIDRLVSQCKGQSELNSAPSSLLAACTEFNRIRDKL